MSEGRKTKRKQTRTILYEGPGHYLRAGPYFMERDVPFEVPAHIARVLSQASNVKVKIVKEENHASAA